MTVTDEVSNETEFVDSFLEHHGIRGMKWGVRRSKSELSSRPSEDFTRAQALRKKNPSSLSNQELKTLNERLNLERQHKQLNPGLIHSGKARAEFILGTIGVGVSAYKLIKSEPFQKIMALGKKQSYKQLKLKL